MSDENSFKGQVRLSQKLYPKQPEKLIEIEKELLEQLAQCESAFVGALKEAHDFYSATGRIGEAIQVVERLASLSKEPGEKASNYLSLGCYMEKIGDYESAITYYSKARALEPKDPFDWYFINNNLGYCLNYFGRFHEAELCCRLAIKVNPKRLNAHKNLGVSLEGQGQWAEAARCYLQAVRANALNPRALRHLESLLGDHPEISLEIPDIYDQIHEASEPWRNFRDAIDRLKRARDKEQN